MVEVFSATSSLLAGAYIIWKGYTWYHHVPKQSTEWQVLPLYSLKDNPWRNTSLYRDARDEAEFEDSSYQERQNTGETGEEFDSAISSIGRVMDSPKGPDDFSENYEVLGRLGRGGFGVVYKAMQLQTRELVAVKCVHIRSESDSAKQEVDMLRSVQGCNNTVRLLDYFQLPSQVIIVMKLASCSLVDMALRKQAPEVLMGLFLDIQNAITFLHDKRIAHRDLKPANILISQGRAVVADFGLAENVKGSFGEEKFVEGGVGTYAYMAPEVIRNSGKFSGITADVWSVGCVMYFLLTGSHLYMGECANSTKVEHNTTVVIPPPNVVRSPILSSMVVSMISALVREPRYRPGIKAL